MSDEVLSRDDVESLLQSMTQDGTMPAPPAAAAKPAAAPAAKPKPKQRVLSYDFKRPERVGKEQMRALQSLHEGLGRNFGAALSAMLRTIAEVKLVSVDQLTYSEFVYSLEIPTCFNLLKPAPLEGNWIVDISPSLLYPVIDRMLGGTVSDDSMLKRPLSEIEHKLAKRVTQTFLNELASAWKNVVELDLSVERVESNPQLVQIVPPNEVVIMVSFEATIGKVRGMTNLCVPFNTIERIGSKLSNNSWIGYASSRNNSGAAEKIAEQLDGSNVPLVVRLATSSIKAADLVDLQIGDIISTEKDSRATLEVEVANAVKFLASPGSLKGRKAVQIEKVVNKPQPTSVTENSGTPAAKTPVEANSKAAPNKKATVNGTDPAKQSKT